MAVYTEVTAEDINTLLQRYDIGALTAFKGIAEGVENSNFFLGTDRGQFILTLYEKRVDPRDLPFFIGLMKHLAGQGMSCPTPVADRDGRILQEIAGKPAALVTFLSGYSRRKPSPVHCGALGVALAAFHYRSAGFNIRRENNLSVTGWSGLINRIGDRAEHMRPGLTDAIAAEYHTLASQWPQTLPYGVIHADLFPDNVFFLGDAVSGVIDFYFACNDVFAYDIAICLNAWCFESDHAFNVTKARALLKGYNSVKPLRTDEIDALPILARGSALRFLLTRLLDWFETSETALVKRKDPMEYWKKLQFHQTVISASAYGLSD